MPQINVFSSLRCLHHNATRSALTRSQHRLLMTTRSLRNESPNVGAPINQKKPIGGFRGGIVGFLFGFSLASSYAAYQLLDEYKQASVALQASVEELKLSTEQVTTQVRRIEAVEKDLKALSDASAFKEDISRVRAEMKELYGGLNVELLDFRAHVQGIQQDVHALTKKNATSVRI
ncbi:hypothetical protein J3R30DRAFT_3286183 [Lentinula aciculospora]|uniref:IncA domain-containing protein n=1 Tax=Lentinula aciculospora TaxID=153920 RepID=A0A9W9DR33_9AGAR|nr:hypothetical protein J3R30DRAFT_3286183 [Lentinula aciculospora]